MRKAIGERDQRARETIGARARRAQTERLRAWLLAEPARFLGACYPGFRFEDFHLAWFDLQKKNRETLVLAPRGHGKTTVCTCAYVARCLLKDPDLRALIVSRTADQARTIASGVRNILVLSDGIRAAFDDVRGRPWSLGAFTLATRTNFRREPSVTALGICGPLVSKHFDLILCDDVLDFENTRTRAERERVARWVGTALEPTLDPGGEIHWIGTRYHPEDYYARLLDPACYADLRTNDGTRAAIVRDGGPDRPLWPARFTLDAGEAKATGKVDLASERRKKGEAIFRAQYMNDVTAMTGRVFRREWIARLQGIDGNPADGFRVRGPDGAWRAVTRVFQGFDPAISLDADADYSAHVTIGAVATADRGAFFAVLDSTHERLTFEGQVNLIRARAKAWKPAAIGIEEVGYQKALSQEVRKRGALPVKGVRRKTDKVSRAYAMQGLLEEGRLWVGANQVDLIDELAAFPEGPHDDLFDALETALSLARNHHRPAQW